MEAAPTPGPGHGATRGAAAKHTPGSSPSARQRSANAGGWAAALTDVAQERKTPTRPTRGRGPGIPPGALGWTPETLNPEASPQPLRPRRARGRQGDHHAHPDRAARPPTSGHPDANQRQGRVPYRAGLSAAKVGPG